MLVATWNVNSLNARIPRVEQWLAEVRPDILCLQETKLAAESFPFDLFADQGYEVAHNGTGQWNGVAIASRVGLEDPLDGFCEGVEADDEARLVSARCGSTRVHSVYVPNGREVGHEQYHYKLDWLRRLRRHLSQTVEPTEDVVVAGDWNIAPTDIDVWDRAAFDGSTHVTDDERHALQDVVEWGLVDTLRARYPQPGLFSYYDYQAGRFHKRQGMRIDYVLASESLADRSRLDLIDRNARKGKKPSDHAPVLAGFRSKPC